jgi:hypothetical protein
MVSLPPMWTAGIGTAAGADAAGSAAPAKADAAAICPVVFIMSRRDMPPLVVLLTKNLLSWW